MSGAAARTLFEKEKVGNKYIGKWTWEVTTKRG